MKRFIISALLVTTTSIHANEIILSSKIKNVYKSKIERDLDVLNNINFQTAHPKTLQIMELTNLVSSSASKWLNERVKYIVEEEALSTEKLFSRKTLYIEETNVSYPNINSIINSTLSTSKTTDSYVLMSNLGAAIYLKGKSLNTLYSLKISNGNFKSKIKVKIDSPRSGVIQIGEGFFQRGLTINNENENAISNSINRLATIFHEARHSDGNGPSLAFAHSICPNGHDYAGEYACDENLNGPYIIGALMNLEMLKSCEDNCSARENETLKIIALDQIQRIMAVTKDGSETTDWDANPESL